MVEENVSIYTYDLDYSLHYLDIIVKILYEIIYLNYNKKINNFLILLIIHIM